MGYRILADVVLAVHLLFILFVALGGFLALRWPRIAAVHLPAALWGVAIELVGWICPLTPLENSLRRLGGEAGYSGGFIERYLLPLIYPSELTREIQVGLGLLVIVLNVVAYGLVLRRRRSLRSQRLDGVDSGGSSGA
jgi:hypothetical protein